MVDRLVLRAWLQQEVTPRATARCAIHPGADHASEIFRGVSQQSWHGRWVEHRDDAGPIGVRTRWSPPAPESTKAGATVTQSQSEISPYDTGARCEPKLWQPNSEAVAEVMHSGETGDIGNVDFTNGENGVVVTVHVSRSDDGMYTVHLMPMCDDDQIRVEFHREKDLAIIEPSTSRPV
ncbi:hypothetical protein ABZ682_18280 [Streptomyces griseoviridis]|uniref:hypothetical protein n=1 Tax=Streptomyces griseoviridis TaxID=45398 RepID=UPI0033D0602C